MFLSFVTKHACNKQTDRQTNRITITKTALALLRRAVKLALSWQSYERKMSLIFFDSQCILLMSVKKHICFPFLELHLITVFFEKETGNKINSNYGSL